jgi:hypothetical protein
MGSFTLEIDSYHSMTDSMTELFGILSLSENNTDLKDCRQVAEVVIPECLMKIFYNYILHTQFIQFYEDWSYFGHMNTTFQELLTHYGIIDPIITWIESPHDIDDFSLDDVISQSPAVMLEYDEDEWRY